MKKTKKFDPFKNLVLDEYEQEIEDSLDRGEWVPVENQEEEKRKAVEAARYTLKKKRNINLRVTESTYQKLKIKAAEEGLPYQTLASSILHKYVNK